MGAAGDVGKHHARRYPPAHRPSTTGNDEAKIKQIKIKEGWLPAVQKYDDDARRRPRRWTA